MDVEETMNDIFYKSQLIVAMPSLADPFFSKSVTCICEHREEGAFGLVINQVYPDITEKDFFKGLDIECMHDRCDEKIHIGGPVQRYNVFVLHGAPFHWTNCIKITPTIGMSSTIDILQAIAAGNGPETYIITTGCAGWGAGQLENEMQRNSWLTCPMDDELIFHVPVDKIWDAAMKKIGIDPMFICNGAGHA